MTAPADDTVGRQVSSTQPYPNTGHGSDDGETPSATRSDTLARAWRIVAAGARIVVPSSLVVSLFFYFGLRYTHEHYLQYGLDDSGFGFSTTDYIIRSLNVTVQPIRVVGVLVILVVVTHLLLAVSLHLINDVKPGSGERVARLLGLLFVVVGVVGMISFWSPGRLNVEPITSARWWLVSVLVAMYGVFVGWLRSTHSDRQPLRLRGALTESEWRIATALVLAISVIWVAYGAFEFTRLYARERAVEQALSNEAKPWNFPLVRIYSKVDLALDDDLDVPEETVPSVEGGYRYRYNNLRLFLQHGDRLVLWPADRSPRSGMFILRVLDDIRVEYEPELR